VKLLTKIQAITGVTLIAMLTMFATGCQGESGSSTEPPKMKMTTHIPEEITTPDEVETSIGTLKFKNGMPDKATIDKVYDYIDLARAVEVFMNTQSGVSMWAFRKGMRDAGVPDNTLMSAEKLTDATGMYLTPNTVTPQTYVFLNLKDGPVVMEAPPGILGFADDMWERYICDIGFVGPDKGKGGKYLFLPPGYKGDVPETGYFVFESPTYGVWSPWRNFAVEGDVTAAIASMRKHTRIYPLSEAGKQHPQLPHKDASMMEINTIQPSNYQYWLALNELVQEEGATPMGPEIAGQIAAIGIEQGKPFNPDARMKKILTEAAAIGNATARAVLWAPRNMDAYYYGPESAWFNAFQGGYLFQVEDGVRNLDGRTTFFYFATAITPAMEAAGVGKGSQYAIAAKDADGNWLDGSKNYKLTLPANIPQENFWSFTNYDTQTRSMQQTDYKFPAIGAGKGFPKDGSPNGPVQQNADGTTDVYFGPEAPEGLASNWIQTAPGRGWFTALRLYSPLQPWFDKTWRPGEIELVE
jgi:hypothetical protein